MIRVPDTMAMPTEDLGDLIDVIYGPDASRLSDKDFIVGRAILTPKNSDVDDINVRVMQRFPGQVLHLATFLHTCLRLPMSFVERFWLVSFTLSTVLTDLLQERVYLSADSVDDESQAALYPMEFLNSLLPSGIPPHRLALKVGAPIMLLRNMNGARGQANGTRLICRGFSQRVIDAEIVTGNNVGARVFIPRIPLVASESDTPFALKRRQFPVRPAFGMTVNKSQGQTLEQVGLYLPQPVFSHGQLYVAMSRVGASARIKIMAKGGSHPGREGMYTKNVVYHEVFLQ